MAAARYSDDLFLAWIDAGGYYDTELKEKIDRYGYYGHSKHIRGGGDDCRQYEYHYDGMPPVLPHKLTRDDTKPGQEKYDHRQLKYGSGSEHHHGDKADVIVQREHIIDLTADLVAISEVQ